jgi:putative PIN family toxin of toxin-antitoxin system
MRCFIDSNILISAGLFPNSVPAKALEKAVTPPNVAIISDYSLDETHRVINKKFPNKVADLELFIYRTLFTVELISTPTNEEDDIVVRDADDIPIVRAAQAANADVLITGDKDLLESDITNPQIITAAEFLKI